MSHSDITKELLSRGLDDDLQLFEVISVVGRHTGIDRHDEPAIIDPTLAVIRELLDAGYAEAGSAVAEKDGCYTIRSWGLPPSDAVARIREGWLRLDESPSLGDVVWLALTEQGEAQARRVSG